MLGSLSAKYESNGNPATIANTKGDLGGKSYGTYQLTVNSGHAQKFADQYGGPLKGLKAGTKAFDDAWKQLGTKDAYKFQEAQHNYIKQNHYQPALNAYTKYLGVSEKNISPALQNVIWSIGVQHGAGGARNLYKNSGIKKGDSQETIIRKLYNERRKVDIYFKNSTSEIKSGVLKRMDQELKDALAQLKMRS